jgi:hypothetical protein
MMQEKYQLNVMLQARFKAVGSLKMLSDDTNSRICQYKHTLFRLKACNKLIMALLCEGQP